MQFYKGYVGEVASRCFPHPTPSLASEHTLKDLKRSQGHQRGGEESGFGQLGPPDYTEIHNRVQILMFHKLYLRHRSFSKPFRCFTYVTAHSPTILSLLLRHRIFTYVTWRAAHESNPGDRVGRQGIYQPRHRVGLANTNTQQINLARRSTFAWTRVCGVKKIAYRKHKLL